MLRPRANIKTGFSSHGPLPCLPAQDSLLHTSPQTLWCQWTGRESQGSSVTRDHRRHQCPSPVSLFCSDYCQRTAEPQRQSRVMMLNAMQNQLQLRVKSALFFPIPLICQIGQMLSSFKSICSPDPHNERETFSA